MPLAAGTAEGIMTRTNQGCRHGVARETRHALFATNPSTMTVTNQRQGMLGFLKGTTNGLGRFVEGRGPARASVPEEDLSSNRKYREGGRTGKDQVFCFFFLPLWCVGRVSPVTPRPRPRVTQTTAAIRVVVWPLRRECGMWALLLK